MHESAANHAFNAANHAFASCTTTVNRQHDSKQDCPPCTCTDSVPKLNPKAPKEKINLATHVHTHQHMHAEITQSSSTSHGDGVAAPSRVELQDGKRKVPVGASVTGMASDSQPTACHKQLLLRSSRRRSFGWCRCLPRCPWGHARHVCDCRILIRLQIKKSLKTNCQQVCGRKCSTQLRPAQLQQSMKHQENRLAPPAARQAEPYQRPRMHRACRRA